MQIPHFSRTIKLPTVALRGVVAFPGLPTHFEAGRRNSITALNTAMDNDQLVFLVTQKDLRTEDPESDDLYEIGCVARIRQFLKLNDKSIKVLVEGLYRAKRLSYSRNNSLTICEVKRLDDEYPHHSENYTEAIIRKVKDAFEHYSLLLPGGLSNDILINAAANDDLSELCDYVASNTNAPYDDRQFILEQLNPYTRAKMLLKLLTKEASLLKIDSKISEAVKVQIDENQREYYLKEQIKAINEELYGDSNDDTDEYIERINGLSASEAERKAFQRSN